MAEEMKTRVKIVNPGLTYDLRAVGIEGLGAAIDAIDAPDPLFLVLTPEQRAAIKAEGMRNVAEEDKT